MKWRVPDQEVHQRGLERGGAKDCQAHKLNRTHDWVARGMLQTVVGMVQLLSCPCGRVG